MIKAHGGRKTRAVKISRIKKLYSGREGTTYEAKIELQKNTKKRKIELVEKEFHIRSRFYEERKNNQPHLQRPFRQYKLYNELKELNRKEKLGLPLIPTMRIVRSQNGMHKLLVTKINERGIGNFSKEEREFLTRQEEKYENIMRENGYNTHKDMWIYDRDPKTNKPRAWIVDFGNITRKKLGKQNTNSDITKWFKGIKKRVKNRRK